MYPEVVRDSATFRTAGVWKLVYWHCETLGDADVSLRAVLGYIPRPTRPHLQETG